MPESCQDRTTSAVEWVLHLAKSGSPLFWTHRDRAGTRTKPAPDYRWIDHANDDAETDVEPPDWRTETIARAVRKGVMPAGWDLGAGAHGASMQGHYSEVNPPRKRWSRINLWAAHDYFYDAEAVKEEAGDIAAGNGFAGRQGTAPYRPQVGSNGSDGSRRTGGEGSGQPWVPSGKRNMRNFWLLGPAPFPEAHFATFPPRIPEIVILAGTSAKGVCPNCKAPWVRVVRKGDPDKKTTRGHQSWSQVTGQQDSSGGLPHRESETLGWRPTCGCPLADPIPATVLDPFAGAGTSLLVADRLGRDAIGIELNPSYVEMIRRRLTNDAGMFADIAAE